MDYGSFFHFCVILPRNNINYHLEYIRPTKMNKIHEFALLLISVLLISTGFSSCGLGGKEDPEYPLFVSYSISAGEVSFEGPEELLKDIKSWINTNQIAFDRKVNYSSGAASEFETTDAEAIKKFDEEFMPKFVAYLNEVKNKLASGTYGDSPTVKASFGVYASRGQGENRSIKYEVVNLVYPSGSAL